MIGLLLRKKAAITGSAIKNGITRIILKYKLYNRSLQDHKLNESTVHTWMSEYKRRLELQICAGLNVGTTDKIGAKVKMAAIVVGRRA